MGNSHSRTTAKIILPDNMITTADSPTTVGELMLEHAHHFVVDFDSLLSEDKAAALPADQILSNGKIYLLIPMKTGKKPALSSSEAREALKRVRAVVNVSGLYFPSCWLCLYQAAEKKSLDKVAKPVETTTFNFSGEVPEFLGRQFSYKGWKPSLHTIDELTMKREPHWLF